MAQLDTIEYEAHARCTGGREGRVVSSDGALDLNLAMPKELTGKGGDGSNPEQLFAASYSAAFIGAMRAVGEIQEIPLPDDITIDATVGVGTAPGGYGIQVKMNIHIPGMDKAQTEALVKDAHQVCSLSNATRNNIDVHLTAV